LAYTITLLIQTDHGPVLDRITTRHIGIALNSKNPLRLLLANEGVRILLPDPSDAEAISIATNSSYSEVAQPVLSSNLDLQPQLLVKSLFRDKTSNVHLIASRLCSSLGNEDLKRFDILHEIILVAPHQQMILHATDGKGSDYLKVRSGGPDPEELDAFDLLWDTSVLDFQRSCLTWDFSEIILPQMTELDKKKLPGTSSHSSASEGGPISPQTENCRYCFLQLP
jgi:hypothetical protein